MSRPRRTAAAVAALVAVVGLAAGCATGRTDGGNPGNLTTTTRDDPGVAGG